MKHLKRLLFTLPFLGTGCVWNAERDLPLSDVPPVVLEAARTAVAGIQIESAELEIEDGQTVYELEGVADGVAYEIDISPDGEVLEVETDEDDG